MTSKADSATSPHVVVPTLVELCEAAGNRATLPRLLADLALEADASVRVLVARNPSTPGEALASLGRGAQVKTRAILLTRIRRDEGVPPAASFRDYPLRNRLGHCASPLYACGEGSKIRVAKADQKEPTCRWTQHARVSKSSEARRSSSETALTSWNGFPPRPATSS